MCGATSDGWTRRVWVLVQAGRVDRGETVAEKPWKYSDVALEDGGSGEDRHLEIHADVGGCFVLVVQPSHGGICRRVGVPHLQPGKNKNRIPFYFIFILTPLQFFWLEPRCARALSSVYSRCRQRVQMVEAESLSSMNLHHDGEVVAGGGVVSISGVGSRRRCRRGALAATVCYIHRQLEL